jgi:hypothetical protein
MQHFFISTERIKFALKHEVVVVDIKNSHYIQLAFVSPGKCNSVILNPRHGASHYTMHRPSSCYASCMRFFKITFRPDSVQTAYQKMNGIGFYRQIRYLYRVRMYFLRILHVYNIIYNGDLPILLVITTKFDVMCI